MVYGTQITIVTGAFVNQLKTGGPHIVPMSPFSFPLLIYKRKLLWGSLPINFVLKIQA